MAGPSQLSDQPHGPANGFDGAVTIVVVTYNSGPLLKRCLAAVARLQPAPRLLVVDNGSDPDAYQELVRNLQKLRDEAPPDSHWPQDGIQLLDNPGNPGFAHACNLGLASTDSEYVLFLNPDCEPETGAINTLLEALQAKPAASLAGPWVVNADGSPQRGNRRRFPDLAMAFREAWLPGSRNNGQGIDLSTLPPPPETLAVDAVSGACMLCRTERLRALGGFDTDYRLHCEDIDLMQRLAQAGDQVLLVPAARVLHHGGASSASRPLWVSWQKHRGMLRYHRKFTAAGHGRVTNLMVTLGVWLHFLAGLPGIAWRKWNSRPGNHGSQA